MLIVQIFFGNRNGAGSFFFSSIGKRIFSALSFHRNIRNGVVCQCFFGIGNKGQTDRQPGKRKHQKNAHKINKPGCAVLVHAAQI